MSDIESVDSHKEYQPDSEDVVKESKERTGNLNRVDTVDVSAASFSHYMKTRLSTLFDLPGLHKDSTRVKVNPKAAIAAMDRTAWNKFAHGFFAWTIDSFDFFCVSVFASDIATDLNVPLTEVTWGITLVLMFRSVGAFIFGLCADKWGRKWPLIVCYLLFIVLEIGTGFVQNLHQFLGVRAVFGIAMGGCYGLSAATALEDAPQQARGFLSGVFLPGYSLGYCLATAFYRAFEGTPKTWRALFWFSAAPAVILLVWRLSFPELDYFTELNEAKKLHNQRVREAKKAREEGDASVADDEDLREITFASEMKEEIRTDWPLLVYLLFMMSGWNFMSHGSQDLFATLLKKQVQLGPNALTVTNIVVNLGGCFGGLFWGQASEFLGRRLAVIGCCVWGGAFIYPTFFIHKEGVIMVCGFLLQFAVMGAWGICPIHLTELTSRSALRTMISGTAYQLGNLASSASSTIEADIGSRFPLPELGDGAYDYGKVMCIFMGCVFAFLLICMVIGPERYHVTIKTEFMLDEEDVDAQYDIDRTLSMIPKSRLEDKIFVTHTENMRNKSHR